MSEIKKMKLFIVFACVFIVIVALLILFLNNKNKMQSKLVSLGYSERESLILLKKVPISNYDLVLEGYDSSIIDIVNSKDYKSKNFSLYYTYYSHNKDSKINNIISIINSGYDLMDYPASGLLALLVKEKYFIYENVARYLDYGNGNKLSAKKIVSIVNANADFEYYTNSKAANISDDYLILVNKYNYLPNKYEPDDLITLPSKYGSGNNDKMRKESAEAFMKMVDGALLDNIVLRNASAYRSYDYQVKLYDDYVKKDGIEMADVYSARAGYSEHQTGLCTDINIIDSSFDNSPESKWLAKNAYKYGFILRFPKNKEKVTGYKYESWHYRYVGVKVAKIMYDNDLSLEEYYAYYVENK